MTIAHPTSPHAVGAAQADASGEDRVERQLSRRSVALGAGFVATAGLAAALTPRRHERTLGHARLADVLPDKVAAWTAQAAGPDSVILPDTAPQEDSPYDQVLTRTFFADNLPTIMLLVAYGAAQSGMMKVHRPEVCYASSGFSVRDDRPVDIPLPHAPSIAAKTFLGKRGDRLEQVLYWTRISNAFPRDLATQRLLMFERGLMGVIPDGVLVRVSTLGGAEAAEGAVLRVFAQGLVASADPQGRALLVGDLIRNGRG